MLFIAIGLTILFISIIAALVMLIRELGIKSNFDDSLNDFSLDFAEEGIPAESGSLATSMNSSDDQINLPQEIENSPPSVDEVVPFPWAAEAESQLKSNIEPEYQPEVEKFSAKQPLSLNRESLQGDFSVRDLTEDIK